MIVFLIVFSAAVAAGNLGFMLFWYQRVRNLEREAFGDDWAGPALFMMMVLATVLFFVLGLVGMGVFS